MIMYTNSIFFEAHLCFTLNYVLLKTVTNRLKMFLWLSVKWGHCKDKLETMQNR